MKENSIKSVQKSGEEGKKIPIIVIFCELHCNLRQEINSVQKSGEEGKKIPKIVIFLSYTVI
jgi:hypothetical protein